MATKQETLSILSVLPAKCLRDSCREDDERIEDLLYEAEEQGFYADAVRALIAPNTVKFHAWFDEDSECSYSDGEACLYMAPVDWDADDDELFIGRMMGKWNMGSCQESEYVFSVDDVNDGSCSIDAAKQSLTAHAASYNVELVWDDPDFIERIKDEYE